jgi:DsbC/DsbD-like thiol-disulfide interchange protein
VPVFYKQAALSQFRLITAISLVRERADRYKAKMIHTQISKIGRCLVLPVALLWAAAPQAAEPQRFASLWSKGLNSSMRLIGAGTAGGTLRAGVEIRLDPKAITYWRNPGDAGAPPVFSFAGSKNVAAAKVLFPAPQRLQEGGTMAFGYQNGVVFPVQITPLDGQQPVTLEATIDYAVCTTICVPARGTARLTLSTDPGPFAALVAQAEERIPRPLASGNHLQITAEPGGKSWLVTVPASLAMPDDSDLFVEAPEGWYFDTQPLSDRHVFRLRLTEKPAAAAPPLE